MPKELQIDRSAVAIRHCGTGVYLLLRTDSTDFLPLIRDKV